MADNIELGKHLYGVGDQDTKDWFQKQWGMWPERADERLTTNISLHFGGILQYRLENDGEEPEISSELRECITVLEKYYVPPSSGGDATDILPPE